MFDGNLCPLLIDQPSMYLIILQLRAAKMGYPDVVAYALDHLRVNPRLKDNAGIPPIHRAAYKVSLFTF